jgi:hypothetical protein
VVKLVAVLLVCSPNVAHAESKLVARLLRILGVTLSSGQLKAPAEPGEPGRLVTKDLATGTEHALTADGGYRWPVFSLDAKAVYALRGAEVVTIDTSSGKITRRQRVAKVDKLVGVDREQPDQVLVLRTDHAAPLALLSLKSGKVTLLPYDPRDDEQRVMLSHLAGEERVYGTTRVSVKTEREPTMAGTSEWQEIYLQAGDAVPRAISACAGTSCREPALSADGGHAVWVRVAG